MPHRNPQKNEVRPSLHAAEVRVRVNPPTYYSPVVSDLTTRYTRKTGCL